MIEGQCESNFVFLNLHYSHSFIQDGYDGSRKCHRVPRGGTIDRG